MHRQDGNRSYPVFEGPARELWVFVPDKTENLTQRHQPLRIYILVRTPPIGLQPGDEAEEMPGPDLLGHGHRECLQQTPQALASGYLWSRLHLVEHFTLPSYDRRQPVVEDRSHYSITVTEVVIGCRDISLLRGLRDLR